MSLIDKFLDKALAGLTALRQELGPVQPEPAPSKGEITMTTKTLNAWRGNDYDARRLLFLGESTYSWTEDGEVAHPSPSHAADIVEGQIQGTWTTKFITTLTRGLTGSETPTRDEMAAAWVSAAFTNFIDQTVGDGPNAPKTPEMWQRARERFPAVLAELRPRTIIVLGKTMWGQMPPCDVYLFNELQAYRLPGGDDLAWCWALRHPSRGGLSWSRLSTVIAVAEGSR